jgi:hypothetical protein
MWIKASERRPTKAEALDGHVAWRASKDYPLFVDRWNRDFVAYEWCRILEDTEPELPQPGQMIWVRHFDEDRWQKRPLLRWNANPVTASISGKNEIIWHEWSLTDPNEPPQPQYRPFANAEEFWPFRECWWRRKETTDAHPPCRLSDQEYGGCTWEGCLEQFELLEDIDGKMVARPFGMLIEPETNIS